MAKSECLLSIVSLLSIVTVFALIVMMAKSESCRWSLYYKAKYGSSE